ncbi:EAP30/Vps36 family-domain-containing protein [Collybia nuda]|uniref:Vacuolar protein-sorting-associated protein 36 n=1 Tax=Collybia nuda TaxID=64659 RepID=A0A9P5YGQ4_9AGAR|nr:EAP30/Vps36 family-domain-containing protein [Collybia nuda]
MALRRCTKAVDGTIPVQALLYDDEEIYASQDNVGIYDGPQKSPNHQAGTIYVTTHRLFYIDVHNPFAHSFFMDLSYVSRTEHYAGLFKSSPKVTLHLTWGPTMQNQTASQDQTTGFESWECEVCAYRNPPGLSPAAAKVCGLCGVPRASIPTPIAPTVPPKQLSLSLPASSTSLAIPSPRSTTPASNTDPDTIACPACTFLNHRSLRSCEICSTELPRVRRTMKSAPSSRPVSPDLDDEDSPLTRMVKISFRKGGDKPFYTVLKRSLKSKIWEANGFGTNASINTRSVPTTSDRSGVSKSGISGILQTVEDSAQGRQMGMMDAFQDLEALMVKAKDMVRLAAELNEKLTAASTSSSTQSPLSLASTPTSSSTTLISHAEPEEATFIRSSLSQLGLQMSNAPVTLDMMKDERRWIEELARELAQVLQGSREGGGMMKNRGIIALDEAWGGWNRARGVALIPPSTFLSVLPHLPSCTEPTIQSRTFLSGLGVLHTPMYSAAAFAAKLSGMLALTGPKTTIEVALEEGITVGLSSEMIAAAEADGSICRDDSATAIVGGGGAGDAGLRWWPNLFVDYVWDGQD